MNSLKNMLGCTLLLLFLSTFGFAQVNKTDDLRPKMILTGSVLDQNGAVIVGAKVVAQEKDGKQWEAVVGENGTYTLKLPLSTFDLKASKEWFCPAVLTKYKVVNSTFGKMSMDFVLDVASSHIPCGQGERLTQSNKTSKPTN